MKLSRSTEYALKALEFMVHHVPGEPVAARTIARHQQIPLGYLLKVMQQLVRGGILLSQRGPQGGFILARPPGGITLLEIIQAIEGPIFTVTEIAEPNHSAPQDRVRQTLNRATAAAAQVLQQTSLSDFI